MKLRYCIILICSMVFFINACKKEIEEVPQIPLDFKVEALDTNIFNKIYVPKEVYNALAIKFNYPVDTVFKMKVDGIENTYRVSTIMKCTTIPDYVIETHIYNHDSIVFCTSSGLWGQQSNDPFHFVTYVTFSVFAKFQVLVDNEWKDVKDMNGKVIKKTQEVRFWLNVQLAGNPIDLSIVDLTEKYFNRFILQTTNTFMLRTDYLIDTPINTNPYAQVQLFIDLVSIKDKQGQLVDIEYVADNNLIIITANKPLLYEQKYNLDVILGFKMKTADSDWIDIGKKISLKTNYETSFIYNESDFLLEYSYPALNQYHFLKEEYPKGYVRFSKMPEAINQELKRKENTFFVRISKNNSEYYVDEYCTYSSDSLYFEYNMPSDFLENEEVYAISLYSLSSKGQQTKYYTYFFRTSKFNNASSKFNDYTNVKSYLEIASGGHIQTVYIYPVTELLDYWELQSEQSVPRHNTGLIQMEILPEESSIFQVESYKVLYEKLAQYPQALTWRTPESMGIPPVINTGYTRSSYGVAYHPGYLTPELIEQGAAPIPLPQHTNSRRNEFVHNFSIIASQDYFNLRDYLMSQGQGFELFITWFTNHNLMFNVNYVLPGIKVVTSTKKFNYY